MTEAAGVIARTGEVGNAGHCDKCDRWVPDGEDLCLGRLRGVTAACCGHGFRTPYVAFGVAGFDYDPAGFSVIALYGESAEAYFAHVRTNPAEPFTIDGEAWMRYDRGLTQALHGGTDG